MIRKWSRAPEPVPALRGSASPRTDAINLKPNYALWAARPYWKGDEAAALLLGLNPNFIWRNGYFSHEARHYETKVHELSKLTARVASDNSFGRPTPARWLAWAKRCGITIPAELEAAVAEWADASGSGNSEVSVKRQQPTPQQADVIRIVNELSENGSLPTRPRERNAAIKGMFNKQGQLPPSDPTIRRALVYLQSHKQ